MKLAAARVELSSVLSRPRPRGEQYHGKLGQMLSIKHRREKLVLMEAPEESDEMQA